MLTNYILNNIFNKCDKPGLLQEIARQWIQGKPFHELLCTLRKGNAKWGEKSGEFKIDHVVNICEDGFSYNGSLLVGALNEFAELIEKKETKELIEHLQLFQKKIKYGLPSDIAIIIYELGFSDRVIAQELASLLNHSNRKAIKKFLVDNKVEVLSILNKYPSYYISEIYEKLI